MEAHHKTLTEEQLLEIYLLTEPEILDAMEQMRSNGLTKHKLYRLQFAREVMLSAIRTNANYQKDSDPTIDINYFAPLSRMIRDFLVKTVLNPNGIIDPTILNN